jgi:hypothetical protein
MRLSKYKIVRLSDSCECETCGTSWAEGYVIYQGDEIVIDKTPLASCYGGKDYYDQEPYKDIIELLGVGVTEERDYLGDE